MGQLCPKPEIEFVGGTGDPTDFYKTIGEYDYDIVEQGKKRKPRNPTGMPKLVLRFW
tara:strand:+ start:321 stop:491 length:171 start_codon:yes stop_codon:yes gene_type:complete